MTQEGDRGLCRRGRVSRREIDGVCVLCGAKAEARLRMKVRTSGLRHRGTLVRFCNRCGPFVAALGGRGFEHLAGGGSVEELAALRAARRGEREQKVEGFGDG